MISHCPDGTWGSLVARDRAALITQAAGGLPRRCCLGPPAAQRPPPAAPPAPRLFGWPPRPVAGPPVAAVPLAQSSAPGAFPSPTTLSVPDSVPSPPMALTAPSWAARFPIAARMAPMASRRAARCSRSSGPVVTASCLAMDANPAPLGVSYPGTGTAVPPPIGHCSGPRQSPVKGDPGFHLLPQAPVTKMSYRGLASRQNARYGRHVVRELVSDACGSAEAAGHGGAAARSDGLSGGHWGAVLLKGGASGGLCAAETA